VIGTGYLGATHAAAMAFLGFEVLGVDVDESKVRSLTEGTVPFFEPGLQDLVRAGIAAGTLRFTTSLDEAADFGDVHFVCVGTPQAAGSNAADLRFVDAAIEGLAARINRPALIVGKSTVPVGTATRLRDTIRRTNAMVDLAWNPEFLREGHAIADTLHPDRLVFGVATDSAQLRLETVYAQLISDGVPVVIADLPTAELVKVAANAFLATKISYINAMAEVCEAAGADVTVLAQALSYDGRIGGKFLKPGLGFGGGCLPKDIRAFAHRAEELGVGRAVAFLHEVDDINQRRRLRTVDLIRELAGGDLTGVRIAALGAAFKPDSDDVRDAPALDVARMLYLEGAIVSVYDPEANANAHRAYPDLTFASSMGEALLGANVVALLTEWDQFRQADPDLMGFLVADRRIVDGRHALDADRYRANGWEYRALGRPAAVKVPVSR